MLQHKIIGVPTETGLSLNHSMPKPVGIAVAKQNTPVPAVPPPSQARADRDSADSCTHRRKRRNRTYWSVIQVAEKVQWHGSHSLDFQGPAHEDQLCAARSYVQIVRVAPLPADIHRWRGLRLAAPQHINRVAAAVRTFDAASLG